MQALFIPARFGLRLDSCVVDVETGFKQFSYGAADGFRVASFHQDDMGIRRGAVDGLSERRWLSISPNASPIEAFRLAAKRTADSMFSRIRPCSSIAVTHYKVRTAGSGIRGSGDGIYERSPARHRSFGKRCRFGARGSHQVKDARAFMEQIIGYDSPVAAPPDRF